MQILVDKKPSVVINDSVVKKILRIYPEEKFEDRKDFKVAFCNGEIEFETLRKESNTILIPWQMFFLEEGKLDAELKRIESYRFEKVSEKLLVKRKGSGEITSKRILDRLIRTQDYLVKNGDLQTNTYCGSLKDKSAVEAARQLTKYFEINTKSFRQKNKKDALTYLIEQIEEKQINVSQGVLSNKILPSLEESRNVYRNTSGFAIKDEKVPFVFIPSEVNPEEPDSRQILTLVYLTVLVGLDEYSFVVSKDFKAQLLSANGAEDVAYNITSEFLLPSEVTEIYRGQEISSSLRDQLSSKYKLSPTAVIVILKKRGIIRSVQEYQALLPVPVPTPLKKVSKTGGGPSIQQSVRKFHGKYVYNFLNKSIRSQAIKAVPAQYLIFGAPNKNGFSKYRKNLGL